MHPIFCIHFCALWERNIETTQNEIILILKQTKGGRERGLLPRISAISALMIKQWLLHVIWMIHDPGGAGKQIGFRAECMKPGKRGPLFATCDALISRGIVRHHYAWRLDGYANPPTKLSYYCCFTNLFEERWTPKWKILTKMQMRRGERDLTLRDKSPFLSTL